MHRATRNRVVNIFGSFCRRPSVVGGVGASLGPLAPGLGGAPGRHDGPPDDVP